MMRKVVDVLLYVIIPIVVVIGVAVFIQRQKSWLERREVTYNCALAEISPDFPAEVKQKCRERASK